VTLSRPQILALLEENHLSPSRALGQNFVADPNTVRRIVRIAGTQPGDRVVEVGGGLGSLTIALAQAGAHVLVVEKDRHLVPVLRRVLDDHLDAEHCARIRLLEADAMSLDWAKVLEGHEDWSMVANLPYNVATPLVADLLDGVPAVRRMTVMVQKEVGERLVAQPGSDAYGAVSVKVAYWAEASMPGTVPSSVFVPRPRVGSALVCITRRQSPAVSPDVAGAPDIFRLVRAGFAQRRKMLRRSLAGEGVGGAAFERAGIDERARAEELSVHDWGRLAGAIAAGAGGGGRASSWARAGYGAPRGAGPTWAAGRRGHGGARPRQADVVAAGNGAAPRWFPHARVRDGDGGPGGQPLLFSRGRHRSG
jgi:16S rRNA (adenine1518-N6/adenine1519-N6)-dimethyltransferase